MANTLNLGNGNWATKEDSLLAYNSENGNFKPLPFDFTRDTVATVVNKAGLIETVGSGEPRIDFSNDAKGALLLEPTRSNLVTYSEAFDNAAWTKNSSSVVSGFISPDGSNNAFKLVTNNGVNIVSSGIQQNQALSNSSYAISFFAKKGDYNQIKCQSRDTASAGTNFVVTVDLEDNTILTQTSSGNYSLDNVSTEYISDYIRVKISFTSATSNTIRFRIFNSDSSQTVGNGTSGIYIYGAQLEQGSYATSYIPNYGNSAGATRSADVCNNGGNEQVINSTEGVLYAEISALANDGTNRQISISNGSTSQRIYLGFRISTNEFILSSRDSSYIIATVSDITNFNKYAFQYKTGNFKAFVNGVQYNLTLDGGLLPTGLDRLNFDDGGGSADFYGNVKDVRVYNTSLTDAELIALTK